MKLGIFYVATGDYINYFENFSRTLPNLFPNGEFEKELVILSDQLAEYSNTYNFGCYVRRFHLIDYPYPLVNLNKFQTICEYSDILNYDYIMYFDADTIIFEKSAEFWAEMKEMILSNKIICANHPFYITNKELFYVEDKHLDYDKIPPREKLVRNHINDDRNSKFKYIITSFFAGSTSTIKKYADCIRNMIGEDLHNREYLPTLSDEGYFNYIYIFEVINRDAAIVEDFITLNSRDWRWLYNGITDDIFENNFAELPYVFINQKYNGSIKHKKKTTGV